MSNDWLVHSNVLDEAGIAVSSGTSIDTDFPITNLLHPFLTMPVKFLSNTSCEIIADLNSINAGRKHVTGVIIYGHNIASNGTITIQANPTSSWGSPAFSAVKTIPDWNESDPDYLVYATGRPPGLLEIKRSVPKLYYPLGQDVGSNRYIRILITVTSPVNAHDIQIHKVGLVWNQQFSINYIKGWTHTLTDNSFKGGYSSGRDLFSKLNEIGGEYEFEFREHTRADARIARWINYELNGRYCFISAEPENENDWDEIRQHMMTLYGQMLLPELDETFRFQRYSHKITFIECVTTIPSSAEEFGGECINGYPSTEQTCGLLLSGATTVVGASSVADLPYASGEQFDVDSMHSTSSNNERITVNNVPEADWRFLISGFAQIGHDASAAKGVYNGYRKNSAGVRFGRHIAHPHTGATSNGYSSFIDVIKMSINDYIAHRFQNDTTAGITVNESGIWAIPLTKRGNCDYPYTEINTASKSVNGSSETLIPLDAEEYNGINVYDTTNDRILITDTGNYLLVMDHVCGRGSNSTDVYGLLKKNGTEIARLSSRTASGTNSMVGGQMAIALPFVAGDYIEYYWWHNNSTALNVVNSGSDSHCRLLLIDLEDTPIIAGQQTVSVVTGAGGVAMDMSAGAGGSVLIDTHSKYDSGNPSLLKAHIGGKHLLIGYAKTPSNANGFRAGTRYHISTPITGFLESPDGSGNASGHWCFGVADFAANDHSRFFFTQDSGTDLTTYQYAALIHLKNTA